MAYYSQVYKMLPCKTYIYTGYPACLACTFRITFEPQRPHEESRLIRYRIEYTRIHVAISSGIVKWNVIGHYKCRKRVPILAEQVRSFMRMRIKFECFGILSRKSEWPTFLHSFSFSFSVIYLSYIMEDRTQFAFHITTGSKGARLHLVSGAFDVW